MINYQITIGKSARKFIDRLSKTERARIILSINSLPHFGDIKALKGHDGYYRLRVGNYRIIYKQNDDELIVVVIDAGNRGQIYNKY